MKKAASLFLIGGAALIGLFFTREAAASIVLTFSDAYSNWDTEFKKASRKHGVPWRWIKAVCWNESTLGLNPKVAAGLDDPNNIEGSKSYDGLSWGLMQVTLATANELRPGTTKQDLNNPKISIDLGAAYLAKMIRRFGMAREKVIRAYNGGPGYASTKNGPALTAQYYAKFERHLAEILSREPGDEAEIA